MSFTIADKFFAKICLDMRKKRHRVIYEKAGIVSEYEAKHAIETAEAFLIGVLAKMGKEK